MTPSSTRAEAGEDTTDRSAPPTPVQGPIDPTIRGGHYDLIAPNLKLAQANQSLSQSMDRTTSAGGLAAPSVSASLGSSRMSQYDPSSQGSENPQKMMQDVSGISTPTGTPRAEHKELEGSTRGSVMGDDVGDTTARMATLDVDTPDRDSTPEPPRPASPGEDEAAGRPLEEDPNQAGDLADLKAGRLHSPQPASGTHSSDQNPINNLAEAGLAQGLAMNSVPPEERKRQGGVAGQRMEDVETPDEVQEQSQASQSGDYAGSSELGVETVTDADSMATDASDTDELRLANVVHGERAAGTRLDESGTGPMTSGDTDHLKEALAEDRKLQADRDAADENDKSAMQTEEDRDEGMNRREQLVRALNQNADPEKDLQGAVDKETKERAQEVTMKTTGREPPEHQDDEPGDGAKTPTSDTKAGDAQNDGTRKSGGVDEDDGMSRIGISESGKPLGVPAHPDEPEHSGKANTLYSETAQQQVTAAKEGHEKDRNTPKTAKGDDGNRPDSGDFHGGDSGTPGTAGEGGDRPDSSDSQREDNDTTLTDPAGAEHQAGHKPMQFQVEPAPIAQPEDTLQPDSATLARETSVTPTPPSPGPENPPDFPSPPTDELDSSAETSDFEAATPLDSSMLKSFPDVPDEQKPRVQVHVSSPHTTPHKPLAEAPKADPLASDALEAVGGRVPVGTPLAKIPGHSKSLSHPPETTTSTDLGSPELVRRDSLGIEGSPSGPGKLAKRGSTRKSPKSPLLDDEDPGDFEGGDGWAVIHGQPG